MKSLVFVNIHYILAAVWRRRYTIITPILVMPIIGGLVGYYTPKQYQTHTSFLVQETAKLNPFLEDFAVSTNIKERMAALNTLLHSRHILNSVAEELDLIAEPNNDEERENVISELSRSLSATLAGSDVVKITFKDENPENMSQILSVISKYFIDHLLAPEKSSVKASETFLKRQIQAKRVDLLGAEEKLAKYKNEHASQLPSLHGSNIVYLQGAHESLRDKKLELAGALAKLDSMKMSLSQTNPVIGKIEEQIVESQSQMTLLRAKYTDQHTKVLSLVSKISHLKDERARVMDEASKLKEVDISTLWNMANSVLTTQGEKQVHPLLLSQMQDFQVLNGHISQLKQEIVGLTKNIEAATKKVSAFGNRELALAKLERDLKVKRNLYEELLERHEMALITGALGQFESQDRIKIIDLPHKPTTSVNSPLWLFIVAGLVGGIGLGMGLSIILEQLDTTIRRSDLIEEMSDLPVLARIPNLTQVEVKGDFLIESES